MSNKPENDERPLRSPGLFSRSQSVDSSLSDPSVSSSFMSSLSTLSFRLRRSSVSTSGSAEDALTLNFTKPARRRARTLETITQDKESHVSAARHPRRHVLTRSRVTFEDPLHEHVSSHLSMDSFPHRPRSLMSSLSETDVATVSPSSSSSSLSNYRRLKKKVASAFEIDVDFASLLRKPEKQPKQVLPLKTFELPARTGEADAAYLAKVESVVGAESVPLLLARSGAHRHLLKLFCERFEFADEPVDMALRKFLMAVQLPHESQQIDRVLDAFASRYHACNPDLFVSPEAAYVVAFSLVMLHTDAFNKNNRRKMQKAEYVKNTVVEGVSADVLECLYDNVTHSPFAETDGVGQLISAGQLASLRPALEFGDDPYSYVGTAPQFDVGVLRGCLARPRIMAGELTCKRRRKRWRACSVVLTLPRLYLDSDSVPTENLVALYDRNARRPNSFIVARDGAHDVFVAPSEHDMNSWILTVNYAAALSTHPSAGADTIKMLEDQLYAYTQQLHYEYRNAKQIQVLAPIMPKTRDALVSAARAAADRIDSLRVDAMRVRCYREILVKERDLRDADLVAEQAEQAEKTGPDAVVEGAVVEIGRDD